MYPPVRRQQKGADTVNEMHHRGRENTHKNTHKKTGGMKREAGVGMEVSGGRMRVARVDMG